MVEKKIETERKDEILEVELPAKEEAVTQGVELSKIISALDSNDVPSGTIDNIMVSGDYHVGAGTLARAYRALRSKGILYVTKNTAVENLANSHQWEDVDGKPGERKYTKP